MPLLIPALITVLLVITRNSYRKYGWRGTLVPIGFVVLLILVSRPLPI